jgi:N-acetylmuramoyl-L-alanine amidase
MFQPMETNEVGPPARRARRTSMNVLRQLYMVFGVGAVLATLFTAWTPLGLVPSGLAERVAEIFGENPSSASSAFPTPTPRPRPRIGIVAGHWGGVDPGAVCPDGFTEVEINLNVATRVKEELTAAGFDVDLLEEYDAKLPGYQALALVSIHADTCQFINDEASGFKVAAALASSSPEKASRLVACIRSRYEEVTGLRFHAGSVTSHMSSYHAFEEINTETTAAIIEIGFLNLDRQILTQQPELLAEGVTKGILCYIYNEDASPTGGN